MFNLLVVFLIGMLISFLGSLPLGSLNISAMQIAGTERVRHAVFFSLGVVVVEVLYVRLSLQGIGWILQHRQLFYFMEWVTVFLFIALALGSFIAAFKRNSSQKNILLNNRLRRFWLGFTMSAVNPLQIPFWFIWSTYLISNNILHPVSVQYNIYTAGIATGTLAGLAVFIVAGKWLIE